MNNSENKVYYMERDGAVKIPEKYDKMNYAEITAECASLSKRKQIRSQLLKRQRFHVRQNLWFKILIKPILIILL